MGSSCSAFRTEGAEELHSDSDSEDDESQASNRDAASDAEEGAAEASPGIFVMFKEWIDKIGFGRRFMTAKQLKVSRGVTLDRPPKALIKHNKNKKIDQFFVMDVEIGTGGYGTVQKAKDKRTGMVRAVKCMNKGTVKESEMYRLRREIEIMQALDHPNIVKLFQVFEDCRCIYLVLELCSGGELFDIIQGQGFLSEPDSACIMQQILRAVHYMHEHGICHRDLKPENFLFLNKVQGRLAGNPVKVIDFGLAAEFRKGQNAASFNTQAGTLYYVAPEVLQGSSYGPACDYWSCGVILYVLLSGLLPFKKKTEGETQQKVMSGKYTFPPKRFATVSEEAKQLVTRFLKINTKDRCTAEKALADAWIMSQAPKAATVTISSSFVSSLQSFKTSHKLKKTALQLAARQMDYEKTERLRDIFMQLDTSGNGCVSCAELAEGLKKANLDVSDLAELVKGLDADDSGELDYTEFLAAGLDARNVLLESQMWAAFRVFDLDDNGTISPEELKTVLGNQGGTVCQKNVEEIMEEVDRNQDGQIDFQEFMLMMKSQNEVLSNKH